MWPIYSIFFRPWWPYLQLHFPYRLFCETSLLHISCGPFVALCVTFILVKLQYKWPFRGLWICGGGPMATLAWRDTWWRARFEIQFNALPNMGFDHQPNSCLKKGCAGRCFKMSTFCLIGDVSFDLCISCGLRPLPLSRLKTRGTVSQLVI